MCIRDRYEEGGKYISYLLTPATVCLAVPLYQPVSYTHLDVYKRQVSDRRYDHQLYGRNPDFDSSV